ncbi:MAG: hypothetical protein K2X87_31920 [Gemmataceae bacterium]|nr:hypothetical protein [Gemmataceae bacterium]
MTATWVNGQVVLDGRADWPEGRRLVVREDVPAGIEFMTEEEQADDPESIRQWIEDLDSIPPVPIDPAEEAAWRAWEEEMRRYNVEAVRRQFEGGGP